jgi:hypothetical protein
MKSNILDSQPAQLLGLPEHDAETRSYFVPKPTDLHNVHIFIPDTQVKPGVPVDHLDWIGRYIVDRFADRPHVTIIHAGDHWDMPSLSSYDKGKKAMEGRRFIDDIIAGNEGLAVLDGPLTALNKKRSRQGAGGKALWTPRRVMLRGNHENRIVRATEADAQLDGILGLHLLESPGWELHDFLVPVVIDGVAYAHYFYNPMSGNPYGGMIENRLRQVGQSFTQGHQQTLLWGSRAVLGRQQNGLVAGACYLHDEDYKGPQGNAHWRGIIVKHEVRDGSYDPMFVSLNYLCLKYEGIPLSEYKPKLFV